jgi:hypothetical protein
LHITSASSFPDIAPTSRTTSANDSPFNGRPLGFPDTPLTNGRPLGFFAAFPLFGRLATPTPQMPSAHAWRASASLSCPGGYRHLAYPGSRPWKSRISTTQRYNTGYPWVSYRESVTDWRNRAIINYKRGGQT